MTARAAMLSARALRVFIGLVLLATGVGKLLDVRGFAGILRSYEMLPEPWIPFAAVAVAVTEVLLAFWLFSGRRLAAASLASCAMHVSYAAWSTVGLMRGLRLSNCGCFGVFLARPLTGRTVAEDLAMTVLSVTLFVCARRLARVL